MRVLGCCDTVVSSCPGVPVWDRGVMLGYPVSPLPRAAMQTGLGARGCPSLPGYPGMLVQRGTGQLFCKVEGVPEATSTPCAHAAAGTSPHPAAPGGGARCLWCRNHKVEMRFWWNKQPRTKKGAGWRSKEQACRDGDRRWQEGTGALSMSAGPGEAACPWPLLPPPCGGDCR